MSRRRLLVATRSAHKLRELREVLDLPRTDLVSLDDLGLEGDPVEDGATFETNAAIKARFGARASGLPTLADDSGLEVAALDGGPGVRTRRYAGPIATDADNNAKLLEALGDVPSHRRGARYVCVLAFVRHPGDPVPVLAQGEWRGTLLPAPRGAGGFGYDPLFWVEAHGKSAAELPAALKNRLSHRARAAAALAQALRG